MNEIFLVDIFRALFWANFCFLPIMLMTVFAVQEDPSDHPLLFVLAVISQLAFGIACYHAGLRAG